MILKIGDAAPEFDLPSDRPARIRLSDYRGEKMALFFYPKDDTSACTQEAISFNALRAKFRAASTHILGVSPDSPLSHQKFKRKHELKIALAADEAKLAANAYGVWREKSLYGRKYMGVVRSSFLIDAQGRIVQIWDNLRVKGHAEAVLAAVLANY